MELRCRADVSYRTLLSLSQCTRTLCVRFLMPLKPEVGSPHPPPQPQNPGVISERCYITPVQLFQDKLKVCIHPSQGWLPPSPTSRTKFPSFLREGINELSRTQLLHSCPCPPSSGCRGLCRRVETCSGPGEGSPMLIPARTARLHPTFGERRDAVPREAPTRSRVQPMGTSSMSSPWGMSCGRRSVGFGLGRALWESF